MISKAIIPVAGWGTRRLPITKAIEKCMLPIGNRPLVDFVVQDCIAAGITDIYFVISEESTQLQLYYGENTRLNEYLKANNKNELLSLAAPPENVSFNYIIQADGDKYGSATPVGLAAKYLAPDESVVVVMGDDFIYNSDGSSEIARLLAATPAGECAMLGVEVPVSQVSRYGVLEYNANKEFIRIVEKPRPEDAPSNLINVSKYVLNATAVQEITAYVEKPRGDEYYITDPINTYVEKGGKVKIISAQGTYLDGGTVEGWLHANRVVLEEMQSS
jgi:UTP--glucose-1-phosphate uridylyltransferase